MKRLSDESDIIPKSPERFKRAKRAELFEACHAEWDFFCSLWPYEKLRWLYAMVGLSVVLPHDVVRLILVDWMHCQCKSNQCGLRISQLTERWYSYKEEPLLFEEMGRLERQYLLAKVADERAALIASGVPEQRLCLIHCNWPHDGLGAIMAYRGDFLEHTGWQFRGTLPAYLDYTCLDSEDIVGIREHLNEEQFSDYALALWCEGLIAEPSYVDRLITAVTGLFEWKV
jgi:hypothetical protein